MRRTCPKPQINETFELNVCILINFVFFNRAFSVSKTIKSTSTAVKLNVKTAAPTNKSCGLGVKFSA